MTDSRGRYVLNTVSGQTGYEPESYLTHPHFSQFLVEVPVGTKSYVNWKARTADEFKADQAAKESKNDSPNKDAK